MLARTGIVALGDARTLRLALRELYDEACAGTLELPDDEEDVHMAVEAELGKRVGSVAGRLHPARSPNHQGALHLPLHVPGQGPRLRLEGAAPLQSLAPRALAAKARLA